jgi:hypothetical protein
MKEYILVDDSGICRCKASREENLHKDKLKTMKKYLVEAPDLLPGDEVEILDNSQKVAVVGITKRPENYPKPTDEEIREQKIKEEMRKIAEKSLIEKGELSAEKTEK